MPVRRGRWLYLTISLVGLALYLWAFRAQIDLARAPEGFPPEEIVYPVRLEGIEAGSPREVRFLVEAFPAGATVTLTASDGRAVSTVLPRAFPPAYLIIEVLSALFFWAVAAFVFAPRADRGEDRGVVRDFYWCTFLYGLGVMSGGVYATRDLTLEQAARGLIQLGCLAALPVLFLHLTVHFPRSLYGRERLRGLFPALSALAVALVVWQSAAFLGYFAASEPERAGAIWRSGAVADLLLVIQVVVGFVILFVKSRKLQLTRERKQTKWLLWGFCIGVTPYVFLRSLPQLLGWDAPMSPIVDRVLELTIPIAFVLAVVRYQFMNIDVIIRRSIIYGALAASMVAIYLAAALAMGRPWAETTGGARWVVLLAVGAFAGFVFWPLRRWIGTWVDRMFFKTDFDYAKRLAALESRLESATTQREVAEVLAGFLDRVLAPRAHAVVVHEGEARITVGTLPVEAALAVDVPMRRGDARYGSLLLGPRRNDRRYIEPDLELLDRTAAAAASALERLRLVQSAAEEASARRRLDELNRLKNDFLFRVAHDLRTPLASISWSAANLLDGVVGEVRAPQREYLDSIKGAAEHLNRLVSNLLEITRLEQGLHALDLSAVDVRDVVGQAAATVRPLAREKDVEIVIDEARGLPSALADADKLGIVAVNVLDNAIKYAPRGSRVEIGFPELGGGDVGFRVRDHGPGFGAADRAALFDRFRQGEPSPHSQRRGFGLGLTIVKTYMDLMHGGVECEDHPEGGAMITCRLPVHRPVNAPAI
jgi:signal transduction histidine kinase